MYHSITFEKAYLQNATKKNTWDDWHLVPSSRPVIGPPPVKTKTVDIPGGDGLIDLTESLTGYPTYNNRTGSIEFIVVNDFNWQNPNHEEWYKTYSDIMSYVHGCSLKMILDDDPEYYYEGRFSVDSWKSDKNNSKITLKYDVGPFKRYISTTTNEDWLWDPFNFQTGIIYSSIFKNIAISSTATIFRFSSRDVGDAPFTGTFTASTASQIRFMSGSSYTSWINLPANTPTSISSNKSAYGDYVAMEVKTNSGTGTLSIDFRPGRF